MKRKLFISVFVGLLVANSNGQPFRPDYNQGQVVIDSTIKDCAICSKQLLTEAHLAGKCIEELELLRNEIFARHGYQFDNPRYYFYFENQSWFAKFFPSPTPPRNDKIKLSTIETKNVNFIKSIETKLHQKREIAFRDLRAFKTALNNDDKAYFKNFPRVSERDYDITERGVDIETLQDLKKVLNYINLDVINCVKCKCLSQTTFDNGYNVIQYSVTARGDELYVQECLDGVRSATFGTRDDGYSYFIEFGGSTVTWIFKMQEDGLAFLGSMAAG
ncbi:hypothetical protein FACS1894156_6440 [Bacteroidia bacterium]|nr:hypothetical protein FACS1894156_6440 [Bacteroidia bacterium]